MPADSAIRFKRKVFINLPYEKSSHEDILLALTSSILALGCSPKLTFQVPDGGAGRMARIFALLKECSVSFHDLSVMNPAERFNMPFELGLACALKEMHKNHDFFLLETEPYRLKKTLTDLDGVDAKIHHGKPEQAISAALECLQRDDENLSVEEVLPLFDYLKSVLPAILKRHHKDKLFNASVFKDVVTLGMNKAAELGLLDRPSPD